MNQIIIDTNKPKKHSVTYFFNSLELVAYMPEDVSIEEIRISKDIVRTLELICEASLSGDISQRDRYDCQKDCVQALTLPAAYPAKISINSDREKSDSSRQFRIHIAPAEENYEVLIR